MLLAKTTPVGIDKPIQQLQSDLHDALIAKWSINTNDYLCYARCYRNKTDDGYIAENYDGNGKYKEVYWDSKLAAISFFGISDEVTNKSGQNTSVHLIFFVDLAKIKPLIQHRADEEIHKDLFEIIGNGVYGFTLTSIEYYLENCLKEYPASRRDNRLKFVDMQPSHCFRLNLELDYRITQNFC